MATNGKKKDHIDNGGGGDDDHAPAPVTKKSKTSTFDDILDPKVRTLEREKILKEQYKSAKPYRHGRIDTIFRPEFVTACKEQIKQNSKVNFKETDLFRVYQSIDLANLSEPDSELAAKMPAVMRLRDVLYSQEWRSYIERITHLQPGTLSAQVDCACNCHAPGCHLLCHDDVIGTRKVSYILYLTEPDWKEEEGGALELYDSYVSSKTTTTTTTNNKTTTDDDVDRREPESCPAKNLLPLFNSMAFFVVEPGVSFHAVQEVLGDRPRLSVQGWYHADKAPDHVENATLNRLKETKTNSSNNKQQQQHREDEEDHYIKLDDGRVQPLEQRRQQRAANADKLLDSDRDYLALYVNETYLTKSAMEEIRRRFEEDSSVQLRHFFRKAWARSIKAAVEDHDDTTPRPKVGKEGYYQWGVSEEWKLMGPPHKQRYLQYQEETTDDDNNSKKKSANHHNRQNHDPITMALPPETKSAGLLMAQLKEKVMQSAAFARYLNYVTSLGVPVGYKGQVRRFRPGLDYTVAHYGILTQKAVLDATICFAAGSGGISPPSSSSAAASNDDEGGGDANNNNNSSSSSSSSSNKRGGREPDDENMQSPEEEIDEADMLWQSDDVGGFECYIEADDYESNFTRDGDDANNSDDKMPGGGGKAAGGVSSSEPADEYNEDDDTNLLSVSASNNTLSLVYRDPGTMRFIKYVGSRAPSSRWDISMEYQVPEDDDENGKHK